MLRPLLTCLLLCVVNATLAQSAGSPPTSLVLPGEVIVDDRQGRPDASFRTAVRGDWQFTDGVLHCEHDDKLYKQFKDHGPIVNYPHTYRDRVAEVSLRAHDCQNVVFTMDGQAGHVFRIKLSPSAAGVALAWAEGPEPHEPIILSRTLPKLKTDEWTTLRVEVLGEHVLVLIDGEVVCRAQHSALAREKTLTKYSFAFGSLSARDFRLIAPAAKP